MAFPLLGALISGAGSLVSGIMGNKAAKKQNQQQIKAINAANASAMKREDNRIQRLVADANKAGIHPLAALGSPVVGSFATPAAAFGGAPITGSAVGDAISAFGNAMPTEGKGLQTELLKAQIRNVEASTANMLSEAQSRTRVTQAQSGATYFGGFGPLADDPAFSTAQVVQDRYGDIAENISGTVKFLHDIERQQNGKVSSAADLGAALGDWLKTVLPGYPRRGGFSARTGR